MQPARSIPISQLEPVRACTIDDSFMSIHVIVTSSRRNPRPPSPRKPNGDESPPRTHNFTLLPPFPSPLRCILPLSPPSRLPRLPLPLPSPGCSRRRNIRVGKRPNVRIAGGRQVLEKRWRGRRRDEHCAGGVGCSGGGTEGDGVEPCYQCCCYP